MFALPCPVFIALLGFLFFPAFILPLFHNDQFVRLQSGFHQLIDLLVQIMLMPADDIYVGLRHGMLRLQVDDQHRETGQISMVRHLLRHRWLIGHHSAIHP